MRSPWLPFVLCLVGLGVYLFALARPLILWDVNVQEARFSSEYSVEPRAFTLWTSPAMSVQDPKSYRQEWGISRQGVPCGDLANVDVQVIRTAPAGLAEIVQNNLGPYLWPFAASWAVTIPLALLYLLWDMRKRQGRSLVVVMMRGAVILAWLAILSICILAIIGPSTGGVLYFVHLTDECAGTLILQAQRVGVYNSTLLALFAGILIELAAGALFWYQIRGLQAIPAQGAAK